MMRVRLALRAAVLPSRGPSSRRPPPPCQRSAWNDSKPRRVFRHLAARWKSMAGAGFAWTRALHTGKCYVPVREAPRPPTSV